MPKRSKKPAPKARARRSARDSGRLILTAANTYHGNTTITVNGTRGIENFRRVFG